MKDYANIQGYPCRNKPIVQKPGSFFEEESTVDVAKNLAFHSHQRNSDSIVYSNF